MKGEDVMSLGTHIRRVDCVTILDLSGLITYGNGSVTVCDAVRKELEKGFRRILLNLRDITYIDSSGVGELIFDFTVVKNSGGDLKLLNLRMRVHDRLQTTSLFNVFEVYDDESAAVASFPA
jgi:anti-sigma B factor antagonist